MKRRGIKVSFYDEHQQKSRSITVYGAQLEELAQHVEDAVRRRWSDTTRLSDRRHKRR